ncbi:ABC transporter substrate-binding protein [Amycolatopsis nigrescens]|uniref:peptide ABC transporter substrate-binding protein n=1 Tax=Amycolatopsis nigrescens TaxID=381445 RepID=UPI000372D651
MRQAFAVLFAVPLLLLTGCAEPDEPAEPGVLTVGTTEPASLLPADLRDEAGRMVTGALWSPLVDYQPATGEVTPRAAESVTSEDQVTWTIRLRAGQAFHDGSPVTASSYVHTWDAVSGQPWASSTLLRKTLRPKEITAPDEQTIRLVLDRPFAQVPAVLAAPALYPLPASVLESRDWAGFAANPVGNGPFRMAEPWRPGTGGRLVRVAEAPGKAREIRLRITDPTGQYDRVRDGGLDLATAVPGERHDAMHQDFAERHVMWPLPEATYLAFPSADGRFQNATARYAVSMAVDRAALEAGPLGRQVDPARSMLPPAVAPGERSGTCRPCTHDAAAAKSLLGQVPFTGPLTVFHDQGQEGWAGALAGQVRDALGIEITAAPRPAGGPAPGPFTVTVPLTAPGPHELLATVAEAAGYSDAGFAQLLAGADAAKGQEESAQRYRLAENQLLRDLPVTPLWSGHGHAVWSGRVHDVTATPFRGVELAAVSV